MSLSKSFRDCRCELSRNIIALCINNDKACLKDCCHRQLLDRYNRQVFHRQPKKRLRWNFFIEFDANTWENFMEVDCPAWPWRKIAAEHLGTFVDEYRDVATTHFREHIAAELMATVWHPRNLHRFKDWGEGVVAEGEDEDD